MKDIETLRKLSVKVSDTDKAKFDRVYDEILYPMMKDRAERLKQTELSIRDNNNNPPIARLLAEIMGRDANLQWLVEHEMKPYIEEKGFKVVICSPNYYVYVRW